MPLKTFPKASGEIEQEANSPLEVSGIAAGEPFDVELSTVPALVATLQGIAAGEPVDVEVSNTVAVTLTSDIASFTFAAAAGASTIVEVTITPKDLPGATKAGVGVFDVFLSDDAAGLGLTGTTASGTVTAKAASGVVMSTYTAKKDLRVQALASGVFILEITDTAKTGFYVCARLPSGLLSVSAQLVTGDYGA